MAFPPRHTASSRLILVALVVAGLELLEWRAKADPPPAETPPGTQAAPAAEAQTAAEAQPPQAEAPPTPVPVHASTRHGSSTTNHSRHAILQGDFADGPAVTRACITCHTEAPHQIMGSIHWTWSHGEPGAPETEAERRGKRYTLNNFCGNLETNEPRCMSCHVGYTGGDLSMRDEGLVDCLACHDTTGTYAKEPTGGGHVLTHAITVHGQELQPPNLGVVARSVGRTSPESCGNCHFYGGGGDGSKHGDLDSSLIDAPRELDVHLSRDGADLTCSGCHISSGHQLAGSRYEMNARDDEGTGRPGERRAVASCESCHGTAPHGGALADAAFLNAHVDRVACATCHVPRIARGGVETKVWWDWSEAGRMNDEGRPIHEANEHGNPTYETNFGAIRWEENIQPTYAWFNGDISYLHAGDTIDPEEIVAINRLGGSVEDPGSRIWPFKVMRGRQAYDSGSNTMVLSHMFGRDETAYWRNHDWAPAIQTAMEAADLPFGGEVGFVETTMHWPVVHMVAPAEDALRCADCHADDGVLGDLPVAHLPGRDHGGLVDILGMIALGLTTMAVLVHALLRIAIARRREIA